jgi:hypothetical protein
MAKRVRTLKKPRPVKPSPPGTAAPQRAPNRRSIKGVNISPDARVALYAAARSLPEDFKKACGLLLPFVTYFQDPFVAKTDPTKAFDEAVFVPWEPGLNDGPTSSRFAIVDYNGDTETLEPPAVWSEEAQVFLGTRGQPLDSDAAVTFQFHQVSVWALLQRALSFFEDGSALGRRIPWAFEGNRLIVVPHAGFGENAFYDRDSKSLQFYHFGDADAPVYTCLSVDVVNHEFAHAVLDGIRPLYNESCTPQTNAFHEFVGDLAAILLTLDNRQLRRQLAVASKGRFEKATDLSSLAEEFGKATSGRPYLRTAVNRLKMRDVADEMEPHHLSEVLTATMFDVLIAIGKSYLKKRKDQKRKTAVQAFYYAAERMQRMAIQPLDLLPPVDVTFRDYAIAACRSQRLADPLDPEDYRGILIDAFRQRGILTDTDVEELSKPEYLIKRVWLSVSHDIESIARSRAGAYRFLDDNREDLLIPSGRDFFIADLYDARKRGRQNLPQPRQIVLEYAWREEVTLEGERFGPYAGRKTTMLCGGTLVFNEEGNVQSWMMKPGSQPYAGKRQRTGDIAERWQNAVSEGTVRKADLLDVVARQIAAGRVGTVLGSSKGMIGAMVPPMTVDDEGEYVRFQMSPHLHLSQAKDLEYTGDRQWQISC